MHNDNSAEHFLKVCKIQGIVEIQRDTRVLTIQKNNVIFENDIIDTTYGSMVIETPNHKQLTLLKGFRFTLNTMIYEAIEKNFSSVQVYQLISLQNGHHWGSEWRYNKANHYYLALLILLSLSSAAYVAYEYYTERSNTGELHAGYNTWDFSLLFNAYTLLIGFSEATLMADPYGDLSVTESAPAMGNEPLQGSGEAFFNSNASLASVSQSSLPSTEQSQPQGQILPEIANAIVYEPISTQSVLLQQTEPILIPAVASIQPSQAPEIHVFSATVNLQIQIVGQQPTGNPTIASYLLTGDNADKPSDPAASALSANQVLINYPVDITVKFISENAGNSNMLGYYFFDANGQIVSDSARFIWLDATAIQVGSDYLLNSQAFGINQSPEYIISNDLIESGYSIGFFLIQNGAGESANGSLINNLGVHTLEEFNQHIDLIANSNGSYSMLIDGQAMNGNVHVSHDTPSQTIAGVSDAPGREGQLIVGFEDIANGDNDFNDVIFGVNLAGSGPVISMINGEGVPVIESISDNDSAFLNAVSLVTQGFIAGDQLVNSAASDVQFNDALGIVSILENGVNYTLHYEKTNSGFDYSYVFNHQPGSSPVPVSIYEKVLQSLNFSPALTDDSDDATRSITLTVTDDQEMSQSSTGTFDVHINDATTFGLMDFHQNSLAEQGLINDALLIPENLEQIDKDQDGPGAGFNQPTLTLALDDLLTPSKDEFPAQLTADERAVSSVTDDVSELVKSAPNEANLPGTGEQAAYLLVVSTEHLPAIQPPASEIIT